MKNSERRVKPRVELGHRLCVLLELGAYADAMVKHGWGDMRDFELFNREEDAGEIGLPAAAAGYIRIGMTFWDVVSSPVFGRLSDVGAFNVLCFDPASWGRRAPPALLGLGLMAASFLLNFLVPEAVLASTLGALR